MQNGLTLVDDSAEAGGRSPTTGRDAPWRGESGPSRVGVLVMVVLGGLLVVLASGCAESPSSDEASDSTQMVASGSWYFKNQWPHDGHPIESQNFVVYSDAASLDARQRLAEVAEEVLAETIAEMGIDPDTMFRFPPGTDKIDLYANKNNVPDWGGGARGYYAGLIIWSFDHEAEDRPTDLDSFTPTLKHELVHVVESLLKGRFVGDIPGNDPRRMPVWFSEGMAEALSGGTGDAVRDLDHMNELTTEYGLISPITFRVDFVGEDFDTLAYFYYYYPMSKLAVEYLMDADGLGKSPEDLRRVMLDMADDAPFATAFETHMGISVADYEEQFFALMDDYLPQSSPSTTVTPFSPISLTVFSIVAALLVAGVLTWGLQQSPAPASATIPTGQLTGRKRPRKGFFTEITMAALVVLGFFIWLLIAINTAEGPSDIEKTRGFATAVGYLVASVAILMWAVRRWVYHSKAAYRIPLLIIPVLVLTAVVIELIV